MTAAFRLWLVRHGETAGQSSIRYHGSNDVPLSDQGRAQIALLPPLLADLRPAAVVHSPLSRAVESAQILAKALAWPDHLLRADERLREISFGQCEGMTESEIAAAFPAFWEARQRGPIDSFPGGESRRSFAQRVHDGIHAALANHPRGDLVVVGDEHDGAALAMELVELRHDLHARGAVEVARGLVGEEDERPDQWRLSHFSQTETSASAEWKNVSSVSGAWSWSANGRSGSSSCGSAIC
mgnify:CR=1 FL=1